MTDRSPISPCLSEPASREDIETEALGPPGPEPHLGEVTVEEATPDTLHLSWTVMEGDFDSFEVQYTDKDGQLQVVKVDGDRNDIILTGLESDHRYLVTLYGFHGQQRVGPAHIEALTGEQGELCYLPNGCESTVESSVPMVILPPPSLSLSLLSLFSPKGRGG